MLPRFLVVSGVVALLYFAEPVIVPLVIATILAFILAPLVELVQRTGLGRVSAVLLVVLVTLVAGTAMAWLLGNEFMRLAVELPTHRVELETKLEGLRGVGGGGMSRLVDMFRELGGIPEQGVLVTVSEGGNGFESVLGALEGLAVMIASAFVVLLLVIFMLIGREDIRNRALRLIGEGRLTGTTRAASEGARRLARVLLAQLAVNTGFGILFGLGLAIVGVPYWLLWGFGAAVLRFIPYVGVLVAAAAPALLAIATSPGWSMPAGVFGLVIVLEIVTANVIEPLLFSKHSGVSPIAILVAAAFWTWLWGPLGLMVSTPLTLGLVVLGQHAPHLRFLSTLLSDRPALSPPAAFYQRLLAADEREALAVASTHRTAHDLARTFDDVLVPVLRRVRLDHRRDGVDAKDEAFVVEATGRVAAQLAASTPPIEPQSTPPSPVAFVLGCPAHHRSEETALAMIAAMAAPAVQMAVSPSRALATELIARIEAESPALIVLAVLPPGGISQASFLCRRLRRAFPDLPIVVAHLRAPTDFDKLFQRMKKAGASAVTTSIAQTVSRINALLEPTPVAA